MGLGEYISKIVGTSLLGLALSCGGDAQKQSSEPQRGGISEGELQHLIDIFGEEILEEPERRAPETEEPLPEAQDSVSDAQDSQPEQRELPTIGDYEAQLERELMKHDRWIEDYLGQDYSEPGAMPLRLNLEQVNDYMKPISQMPGSWYRHGSININSDSTPEQTIESIDHAVLRGMWEYVIVAGDYEGPSMEEIAEVCEDLMDSQAYRQLRRRQHARTEMQLLFPPRHTMRNVERLERIRDSLENLCEFNYEFRMPPGDDTNSLEILDEVQDERLHNWASRIIAQITTGLEEYREVGQEMTSILDKYRDRQDQIDELAQNLEQLVPDFDRYCGLLDQFNELEPFWNRVMGFASTYQTRIQSNLEEIQARIARELSELDEGDFGGGIIPGARIPTPEQEADRERGSLLRWQDMHLTHLGVEVDRISAQIRNAEYIYQEAVVGALPVARAAQIQDTTTEPKEIFIRMLDAVYSMHVGEPTEWLYTPAPKDLEFLERFMYEDEQLFRKGIEKYKIAREMQDRGMEELIPNLEYVTGMRAGQLNYEWPSADIDIVGLE